MTADDRFLRVVRWIARIWAAALFVFWGAFFMEHLGWFASPAAWPPPAVWMLQLCHLALLAGLAIGWKWELPGGVITLASAVVFFGSTAGPRALPFVAVTAVPAVLWIVLGLGQRPERV